MIDFKRAIVIVLIICVVIGILFMAINGINKSTSNITAFFIVSPIIIIYFM